MYASATIRHPSAAWLHYLPSDVMLAAAMGAWVIAIRSANVGAVNDYGLLPALPPVFYGSLLIIVVSFVWTLSPSRPSQPRLWLHLMALVLVIHGTPALLFPEPWYAWVYKHVGVVAYISAHGAVNGNIDIYQNWPGFFALVAWVDRIAGVSTPLSYAAWAPVYFEVLTLLALLFAIRPLTPSIRVRWIISA